MAEIIAAILAAATSVVSAAVSSSDAEKAGAANQLLIQKQERQEAQQLSNQTRTNAIGERRQAMADSMAKSKFDMDMQAARDAQRRGAMGALTTGLQNNLKNNSALRENIKSYFRSSL